ncbi:MAG TPA: translocation/assembly module TamB domain-containing protein [Pararhodobacter sp.]|uniref:translocation/assembly module TamB domain-containing protein n=1 Tax=Pararhodobacter sp. TaxID=2127056 RepID=UPI002CF668FF|nr:translocation/assembly module TamB domain-containing protein [Pararhodobacter sp.]HPD93493.1 translocation/assembly module TamB domain-containing protein [Pararhodobacter sp.]
MARRTRFVGWLALLLALMLLAAAPARPSPEEDQGILAGMLQDLLSGAGREVRIRGFSGALSSRATIQELTIADDQGVWITLHDVVLDWNRAALLDRRVEVNELSAQRITVSRLPSSGAEDATALPSPTASEGFRLPELPVAVQIGTVRAEAVVLEPAVTGRQATLTLTGSAQLEGRQGTAQFDAHRTDGTTGVFRFSGGFDNRSRELALSFDLTEGPDGIASTLLGIPGRPALGMTLRGTGPISTFTAQIGVTTNGTQQIAGIFSLVDQTPDTGVLQGGGFTLDVQGDLRSLIPDNLHPFFGANSRLRATGQRSEAGEIEIPELLISTNAMRVNGTAALGADGLPLRVQVTAGIARGDGEPVLLPGTSGAAQINRATLQVSYDQAQSRDWTVRGDLETLALPGLRIGTTTLDARGRLNAAADVAAHPDATLPLWEGSFEFAAQGIEADDPAMQQAIGAQVFGLASLSWPGGGAPLDLTGLALEGQTVSLTAYGQIEGLTFDGYAEFEAPDLSAFSGLAGRPLAGDTLVTLRGQANPLTGALDLSADLTTTDLSVNIPEADAFLAGQSTLALSVMRDTQGTELRNLTLNAGTAEIRAQGRIDPNQSALSLRFDVADLSRLGDGYGGRLALDSRLNTTGSVQRLQLDGAVIDLQLADLPASSVVRGLFFGANRLRADLVRDGQGTHVNQFSVQGPRLDLAAAGLWSPEAPDLTVTLNRLDMAALSAGGQGQIAGRAEVSGDAATTRYALDLRAPRPVATGIRAVDALVGQGAALTARVTTQADGALDIDNAHLDATGLSARISGAQAADGRARFAIEATLDNLDRIAPGLTGALALRSDVTRAPGDSGYGVSARVTGPSDLNLTIGGQVHDTRDLALTLDGQVRAALFNPLIEPANVAGLIVARGTITGRPALDSLRMTASIRDARYVLPPAGVAFRDIEATAQIRGLDTVVHVEGTSLSGGRGTIDGAIRLNPARDADLRVTAQDLVVQQPNLFQARVTGSVSLVGALAHNALVSGHVTVNQAEIEIPNSPLSRQGVGLAGLVHVGEGAASRETRINAGIARGTSHGRDPIPLRLDLTLDAPNRVFVRGRGLDAELGGQLRLGGSTREVVPAGSFGLIRGRLDLLGNRFTLTDGSASMIGSFIPFVSLTATTESEGVTTSVTLSGQANSPEITFSSVPELPQDEVLARLIFRRSLASLSPFQAAQLALSVATLTGRAENSILSRTRQAMGLDDLDFTVDAAGNTQLRAGRHVGERVYTDVSVDSAGQGEVTINLDLTPNVTLRGRADTDGGSGIGIFFERDY